MSDPNTTKADLLAKRQELLDPVLNGTATDAQKARLEEVRNAMDVIEEAERTYQPILTQKAADARVRAEIAAQMAEACRIYVYKLLDSGRRDWHCGVFEYKVGSFTLEVNYQP